jgi:hypothetical protein
MRCLVTLKLVAATETIAGAMVVVAVIGGVAVITFMLWAIHDINLRSEWLDLLKKGSEKTEAKKQATGGRGGRWRQP